jgi:hypothetical protein
MGDVDKAAPGPVNGADLLKRIKPTLPTEHVEVCLRPDLFNEHQLAQEALQEAKAKSLTTAKLSDKQKPLVEAAQKVKDIEAQIREASVWFRFRAIPVAEFRALCDNHPPRANNDVDLFAGFHRDKVLDELVFKSMYEPEFDDESWDEMQRALSTGEYDQLREAANRVNRGVVEAPKSVLASQILGNPDVD